MVPERLGASRVHLRCPSEDEMSCSVVMLVLSVLTEEQAQLNNFNGMNEFWSDEVG